MVLTGRKPSLTASRIWNTKGGFDPKADLQVCVALPRYPVDPECFGDPVHGGVAPVRKTVFYRVALSGSRQANYLTCEIFTGNERGGASMIPLSEAPRPAPCTGAYR